MPNQHVLQRLAGIQQILMGVHQASSSMSSATSGQERAAFIDQFLSQAFPSPFRFGTGDATDTAGVRSGQLDVVVEFPFMPSLPLTGGGNSRLYLAESVAAVIEVKSNVAAQWNQGSPYCFPIGPSPTKLRCTNDHGLTAHAKHSVVCRCIHGLESAANCSAEPCLYKSDRRCVGHRRRNLRKLVPLW